jgi:GrpB-like predicted nucleotidyltransferase (UPF0157 family)
VDPTPSIVIGRYTNSPAVCLDYDPRAPEVARRVGELITAALPAVEVDHIGSTAVPGCAGKGIIDLMVLYPEGQLEAAREAVDRLGFQRQTSGRIFPETRPMRVGSVEYQGTQFRINAHLICQGAAEAEELRRFRDSLRSDPVLLENYVRRKRELIASGIVQPARYSKEKGKMVDAYLATGQKETP